MAGRRRTACVGGHKDRRTRSIRRLRPCIRRRQEVRRRCPLDVGTQSRQPTRIPPASRAVCRVARGATHEPALTRFDRLRRYRNRSEYGPRTFGKAEVAEAIDTAQAIRAACAKLT